LNRRDEEIAVLNAQLEHMAKAGAEAEGFLSSLATALFPGGVPGIDGVTWPDKPARDELAKPQTAEERLRSAEVRFRTLVEQIPAVTFLAVLGDGKNEIYVSPHIEQLLGFSQQEWLDAPFLWYWQLHPDDRQVWNDEFTRGCQTGGPFKAECRFIARDGRVVWVRGEARLVRDELGRPMLLQGIAFDITESKKAQEVLLKETTRKAKEQQETAIAHRVQTSILPRQMSVKGLELSATMVPADDVGGDYYDVQPCDGGAWMAIGDVSGHGLDSGLVMMMLQSALAAIWRSRPEITPREALLHANALMFDNIRSRLRHDDHVTLTLLKYAGGGRFIFAGAHEDIIVCRASGKLEAVRTPGTWVGGMAEIGQTTIDSEVQLLPGDVMVLYTDGLTEAMNAQGELFELDRLSASVQKGRALGAEQLRDQVLKDVRGWMSEQKDDMTLLVVRYLGDGSAPRTQAQAQPAPQKPAAPMRSASLLDGKPSVAVPQLDRRGGPGRLSATGGELEGVLALRLTGAAEIPDVESLGEVLEALHQTALSKGSKRVELDLRSLTFMSSSCLKRLVAWLAKAGGLSQAQQYRVRFVGDPSSRWQRTSVAALEAFMPSLMEKE
jgi:PAS domain S-box-containing protein